MNHNRKIGIIGLGYVGLPLALAFAKKYSVVGYDIDKQRIAELRTGLDRTREMTKQDIESAGDLQFSDDTQDLANCTIYIITVPTPLQKNKEPDLQYLLAATSLVASVLQKGDLVIYESTVYPGCTEEDCIPVLEKISGLIYNRDFSCGYSPERINPGDKSRPLTSILKITSGSNPEAAESVDELYRSVITAGTYRAPSIKVAEAAKAIENAQRDVNISFMNELSLIFDRMGIDTQEVLSAAATKWNFLPFQPGLVGGHCIGVDPHYLAYKASQLGYEAKVILSGREVNEQMGAFVAQKTLALLSSKKNGIPPGAKVLILGFAFKENCSDTRNTQVAHMYQTFLDAGLTVTIYDPLVDATLVKDQYGITLSDKLDYHQDAVVLAVAHSIFSTLSFKTFKESGAVIFDTKATIDREWVDGRL
jgi:UDP-N-acetyl-D-glucosamine/UDP-N-acetyl-D-galactosamine dehydrogenase